MNALLLVVFLIGLGLGMVGTALYIRLVSAKGRLIMNTSDPMKDIYSIELDDLADLERYNQVILKVSQR